MKTLIKYFFIVAILLSARTVSAQAIEKWKIDQLEKFIAASDKPLIINFWATFCKPCIEEIPYFESLVKKHKDKEIKLLLVSLDLQEDYPEIKKFAAKHKFAAPIVFLNETNADIFCPKVDEKWSGAIPATLLVNNQTGYRKFYEEQIPEDKLEEEIKMLTK